MSSILSGSPHFHACATSKPRRENDLGAFRRGVMFRKLDFINQFRLDSQLDPHSVFHTFGIVACLENDHYRNVFGETI